MKPMRFFWIGLVCATTAFVSSCGPAPTATTPSATPSPVTTATPTPAIFTYETGIAASVLYGSLRAMLAATDVKEGVKEILPEQFRALFTVSQKHKQDLDQQPTHTNHYVYTILSETLSRFEQGLQVQECYPTLEKLPGFVVGYISADKCKLAPGMVKELDDWKIESKVVDGAKLYLRNSTLSRLWTEAKAKLDSAQNDIPKRP